MLLLERILKNFKTFQQSIMLSLYFLSPLSHFIPKQKYSDQQPLHQITKLSLRIICCQQRVFFLRYEYKLPNQTYYYRFMSELENRVLQLEAQTFENNSSKTCSTMSEVDQRSPTVFHFVPESPHPFRFQLFEESLEGVYISQKVNQRAVSWIITICWSKSISQQCLWSALLLYYTCKAKRRIRKQHLELTLLTCLCLSLKMTETQSLHPRELAALSSKQLTAADIIEMQETILQLVDYNLVIPHQLYHLLNQAHFCEDLRDQILMVCELLMMKDYNIFLNSSKLECIMKMLGGGEMQKQGEEDLLQQIRELLRLKQSKIILHKYSSKFDTEIFKARFF